MTVTPDCPVPPAGWPRAFCALAALALAGLLLGHGQSAPPANAMLRLRLLSADRIAQHGLAEWEIGGVGGYANPYDPDDVSVRIEVRQPSGKIAPVPAFFHQPHEYARRLRSGRQTDWIYPTGAPGWRARFAPVEMGRHEVVAVVEQRGSVARSSASGFICEGAGGRGFIRVSPRDPRFFEFSDGAPFFPIGQNLAFIGASQYVDLARADEVFGKLAANGANFLRVWTCCEDWALAIEARKSAWGRSWDWRPPFAPAPGGGGYHGGGLCVVLDGARTNLPVSPSHPVALRAGQRYRLTAQVLTEGDARLRIALSEAGLGEPISSLRGGEWSRFAHELTAGTNQWWLGDLRLERLGSGRIWVRDLSLREADGGPELLWEADPNRPARGVINQPDAWALDQLISLAARHGLHLQLCLLTRDHYLSDLREPASRAYASATDAGRKLLRYAVARWGWSPNVAAWEYFNEMDPGAPTGDFYRELGVLLAGIDPHRRPRTTSGWGPAPDDWQHPELDSAQLHWYLRPAWGPLWKDEIAAVLDRAALVGGQASRRPALLAEFGLADDRWGLSLHMRQDTAGVHVHNALWASAFSGLAGAAMFWWWETLDQQDAYAHYRPLARFVADVPFTTGRMRAIQGRTEPGACRVLAWQGADQAYAWINHPDATWWNRVVTKAPPRQTTGERLALAGLEPGGYAVEWWDTRRGEVIARTDATAAGDQLQVVAPEFTDDVAVKVRRRR